MKVIALISILIFNFLSISAQPYRETRAVWVTTNFQLDWPPKTYDEVQQKSSLRNIFKELSKKHFNTVYFQVRSNGTVMYNSDIEPFSPYFTGEVGIAPNFDPLDYAIKLGKEFGLEVHAWVNMIRCFSGADDSFLKHPKHIRNSHPDYTVRVMDENGRLSYWLNPGYFRAQDYLVDLLVELTSKYDLDGIHLDFFRYPGKNFEDEKYFSNYELNIKIEDWRRNNLTTILRKFKDRSKPLNSYLKVGATPIGIRTSLEGARGWEGYSNVFQDTETWLDEGLVDYLTPQIYWDFEKNPKFDILAKDWVDKAHNKNIVLGLAAYKSDVQPVLDDMINYSRKIGAAGISFFRYKNLLEIDTNYFSNLAFPAKMDWKEVDNPVVNSNIKLSFSVLSESEIYLSWKDNQFNNINNLRYYALYNDLRPLKIISLNKNKLKLKFGQPKALSYNYHISKLNRIWNDAALSNQVAVEVPYLSFLKGSALIYPKPIFIKESEVSGVLALISSMKQKIYIDFINIENLTERIETEALMGMNLIAIEHNLRLIKSIRIYFTENNRVEELKFL